MNTRIYKLLEVPDHIQHSQFSPDPEELAELNSRCQRMQDYKLSPKNLHIRESLVSVLIEGGRRFLQLRVKTIELGVRLFDLYCYQYEQGWRAEGGTLVKRQPRESLLEKKENGQLILLSCAYTAAKYNEIYPPSLNDFLFIFNDRFQKLQILLKEVEILALTDFNLAMPVLSSWYQALYGKKLPHWGLDCYIKCYSHRLEELAHAVRKVDETMGSSSREGELLLKVSFIQKTLKILNCNGIPQPSKKI